jgi:hypothetical protein
MLANGTAGQLLQSNGTTAAPSWVASPTTTFASSAENAAGTIENKAVDPLGIREAFNATGTAPVYACRAWVNFNGTGTVDIRASGNVSSITDNGVGDYTVNFTNSQNTSGHASVATCSDGTSVARFAMTFAHALGSVRVGTRASDFALFDASVINVSVFA